MSKFEVSEEIRRNFHLFWDNFPAAVMLVYKDRTILDRNKAAQEVEAMACAKCSDIGDKSQHTRCLAGIALREQTAQRRVELYEPYGLVLDSYWIPLAGQEDVYLHFGIDISEYAAERLFQPAGTQK